MKIMPKRHVYTIAYMTGFGYFNMTDISRKDQKLIQKSINRLRSTGELKKAEGQYVIVVDTVYGCILNCKVQAER